MKNGESSHDVVAPARLRPVEIANDSADAHGRCPGRPCTPSTRPRPAILALFLSVTALSLNGCGPRTLGFGGDALEPVVEVPPPMDAVLVSDLLRFFLDGDMEMHRGIADCYDGLCIHTDGERTDPPRIVFSLPRHYAFAGHHDEDISAHEDTIEDRNGIMIGDVSLGDKDLPDVPGVAIDRTVTGYGGWGEFHGFDSLYYDFVRGDRPQRMIQASIGGWASEGNPPVPRDGTWTWTGGAVGVGYSDITQDRVLTGNSELTVSLDEQLNEFLVRLDITDLEDVDTGTTYDPMVWANIPLRNGSFETFEVRGRFFGPNHEEIGGAFESRKAKIVGAFGASREE